METKTEQNKMEEKPNLQEGPLEDQGLLEQRERWLRWIRLMDAFSVVNRGLDLPADRKPPIEEIRKQIGVISENMDVVKEMLAQEEYFERALQFAYSLVTLATSSSEVPVEIGDFGIRTIEKALPTADNVLGQSHKPGITLTKAKIFQTLSDVVLDERVWSKTLKQNSLKLLEKYSQEIIHGVLKGNYTVFGQFTLPIIKFGSDEKAEEIKRVANILIDTEDEDEYGFRMGIFLAGTWASDESKKAREAGELILANTLAKRYDLDSKQARQIINAWRVSGRYGAMAIESKIGFLDLLEHERKGIIKFLLTNFGIKNFDRYTVGLLLTQYNHSEDLEKPYGVIINPENDYNGAFLTDQSLWDNLRIRLKNLGYNLRVVEAINKMELGRYLIKLDQKYGATQKISFAIIGGHGTVASINFGGSGLGHQLLVNDFLKDRTKRAGKFLSERPTIILNSCSTGFDYGIGETMSETLNATVIAPDVSTSIAGISVKKVGNDLEFHVIYSEPESRKEYVAGVPQQKRTVEFDLNL